MKSPASNLQKNYKASKNNYLMDVKMTPDLAEVCGIHAGDGYMRKRVAGYEFEVSGGFDEKEYYDSHVVPLFERVFDIQIYPQYFKTKHTYGFRICKKEICEILHACGFPYGKKTFTVSVPKQILESRDLDIIYRFIRGAFDTDGCLAFKKRKGSGYREIHTKRHTLAEVAFACCSKNLRDGICKLLIQTGISFAFDDRQPLGNRSKVYRIYSAGDHNLIIWMANISFKNTTKLNRFFIWQKHGFCPSGLNISQQRQILSGNKDPNEFYGDGVNLSGEKHNVIALRQISRLRTLGISIPKD